MKVTYPGPLAGVRLLDGTTVERGQSIDVPDDVAASLVEQGWTVAKVAAKKVAKPTPTEADAPANPKE